MSYLPMLQQYTKNPLDDEEVVQRIISAYAASFHFDQNFYNALFSQYSNGGAFFSPSDIDLFYSTLFNIWKNNVEEPYHTFLEDVSDVKSLDEVFKELSSSKLRKKFQPFLENKRDSLTIINSSLVHPEQGKKIPFPLQHQLFINIDYKHIHKLATLYLKECEEKGLPYFFKMFSRYEQDDSFVAFADDKHFDQVFETLNSIIENNPELRSNIATPPILSGKITSYIGYTTGGSRNKVPLNTLKSQIIHDVCSRFYFRILETAPNFPIKDENGQSIALVDQICWNILNNKIDYMLNLNKDSLMAYYGISRANLKEKAFLGEFFSSIKSHLLENIPNLKEKVEPLEFSYSNKKESYRDFPIDESDFYRGVFQTFPQLVNSSPKVKTTLVQSLKSALKDNGFDPNNIAFDFVSEQRILGQDTSEMADGKSARTKQI